MFSFSVQAQTIDSIKMTSTEYPSIVIEVPNKLKAEIYTKVKSWINRYYKNPNIVIAADEPDNYVRLNGSTSYSFKYMGTTSYSLLYSLEIELKDNRYKVKFINVKSPELKTPDMPGTFYDSKGGYKGIKSINQKMRTAVLFELNNINTDLFNYINSNQSGW